MALRINDRMESMMEQSATTLCDDEISEIIKWCLFQLGSFVSSFYQAVHMHFFAVDSVSKYYWILQINNSNVSFDSRL